MELNDVYLWENSRVTKKFFEVVNGYKEHYINMSSVHETIDMTVIETSKKEAFISMINNIIDIVDDMKEQLK